MIDIKEISGNIRVSVAESEKAIYKKELMKEEYILLSFSTQNVIAFQKCDYIETEFGRFELLELPVPAWNNTTGGYDYEARFDHPFARFKNYILFYTRQGSKEKAWSLTAKIDNFKAIINDNFKRLGFQYEGSDYELLIGTGIEDITKTLSFDSTSIWDAINKIAEEWETEWTVSGNEITIDKCETVSTVIFDRSNMSEITKESDEVKATRIYPFGSTRNISSYYGKELIFEVAAIDDNGSFIDFSRRLKPDYFLKKNRDNDNHLTQRSSSGGDNYLNIYYTASQIPSRTQYLVDFSQYELYINSLGPVRFEYEVYNDLENKSVKKGNILIPDGRETARVPLSNFDLSKSEEAKFSVRIKMEDGYDQKFDYRENGHVSIGLKNPKYKLKVKFLSGQHKDKTYDCYFNPYGLSSSDPTQFYDLIQIVDPNVKVSFGDQFRPIGVIYKNLPASYFTTPAKDVGVVTEGVVETRLRLPDGMDHINAWEDMRKEDVIEGVVVFDEIYPHREGTISDVTSFEIDEIDSNDKLTGNKINIWRFKDSDLNFSKEYVISDELKVHFQTGSLAGLDFGVVFEPNSDKDSGPGSNVFEVVRNEDYGLFLPNDLQHPKVGDIYILSGYDTQYVSDKLIPDAENDLLKKATEYVQKPEDMNFTCKTNPVRCAGYLNGGYDAKKEMDYDVGQKVNLIDPGLAPEGKISRVYSFEKRLDHKFTCTYTLGLTASYSRLGELETKVDEIIYKSQSVVGNETKAGITLITTNDPTLPTDQNAFSAAKTNKEIAVVKENITTTINQTNTLLGQQVDYLQGFNLPGNAPGFMYPFVNWGSILFNEIGQKLDSLTTVLKNDGYYRFKVSGFIHELFQASHGSGVFQQLKGTVSFNKSLDWSQFGTSIKTYKRSFLYDSHSWSDWIDADQTVEYMEMVGAIDVSNTYPTGGTGGTNVYTLAGAIAIVPSQIRKPNLIISFLYQLNNDTVIPVSYRFNSTDVSKWTSVGNWSKQPGTVPMNGIDSLIKPELCGEYSVIQVGKCIANLSVTSDFAGHVINQFIKTNLIPDESGAFDGTHEDSMINMYMRIYNINATISGITKGTFGKWIRMATDQDLAKGTVRYFGGYLDSCKVEPSDILEEISPKNVFYTQKSYELTSSQGYPSIVGRVGDKYYRQFGNVQDYSESGISLDAGKVYIDVNNNIVYVADPDFLYGTIKIGGKERFMTQEEYDSLDSYDGDTKYYIIEE